MALVYQQVEFLRKLLRAGSLSGAGRFVDKLEPAEIIDLLESVGPSEYPLLLRVLFSPGRVGAVSPLRVIPKDLLATFLERLDDRGLARLLKPLSTDDAVTVLELVGNERAPGITQLVSDPEQREQLRQALHYPPKSAGRLMNHHFLAAPESFTAQQAIELVRAPSAHAASTMSDLYTVDARGRLTGLVPFWKLVRAESEALLSGIMEPEPSHVTTSDDQELVATLAARYGFLTLPVVDAEKCLVGIVTMDDVLDVMQDKATEDLYRLQGISDGDRLGASVGASYRRRIPWMSANLVTAFLAASVVGLFEHTIAQLAVLAIFMPVVAGMGGNVGTQVLTVVTRGMALGEDRFLSVVRVLGKQLAIGVLIGASVGAMTAGAAYLWKGDPRLGVVLFLAMIINLAVAGLAGATVPTLLKALGLDPALGSGVLVTTCTDVVGFFSFLGLASLMMT